MSLSDRDGGERSQPGNDWVSQEATQARLPATSRGGGGGEGGAAR